MGDSIPCWAGRQATTLGKPSLETGACIRWKAVRGLGWPGLRKAIEVDVLFEPPPQLLIIHLGGNDLVNMTNWQLKNVMDKEMRYLKAAFDGCQFVWLDILPRRVWHGAHDLRAIEQKRKRVNRMGRQLTRAICGGTFVSCSIQAVDNCFRADGIHLNEVGLEFYLGFLRDTILQHLKR